jgi:hypothetical protein
MKKAILLLIILATSQIAFSQSSAIAKFKFEEAEQAYVNEDYKAALTKLEESEKLFGKVNPPILYLRIMAQNNLLGTNPHDDPALLLALHNNCKFYLKEYANLNEVEDKYREVYQVSDYIKIYSDSPDFFKARSLYYGTEDTPQDLPKAFELCTKLIKNGDDHAMNLMGVMHLDGKSVEKDNKKAMEWYQKAADKGNVFALTNLARQYSLGKIVDEDNNKALKLYQQAGNKGFPNALYVVGGIYYYGEGVSVNYDQAFSWYQKAAAKKNASAMSKLGYMYLTGKGVSENEITALDWTQKAANLGNNYGMYLLGSFYRNGWGLTKNPKEALNWYLKAANNGYHSSIPEIADMYNKGEGTERNYKEAYKWYLMAAEDGDSDAMWEIGSLYYRGQISNSMDAETTNNTQNNSTEQIGIVLGGIFKGDSHYILTAGKPNYTEAMNWYLKAYEKNNVNAMKTIANMYLEGLGVKKDKKLAKEWNNKALIAESQKK